MANKLYTQEEAAVVFADSAQTPDADLTLANLAAGAGRVSAQHDFGAAPRPARYKFRATLQFETAPVVGEQVELYLSTSDGSNPDGEEGATDAALGSSDSLNNMQLIGILTVTSTDAAHNMTASGVFWLLDRYASVVVYNNTADNLKNNTGVNSITLTPFPPELQ